MDATFTALPAYAELFCLSNFSFLHGASQAEELAQRAAQLGYSGLAITDECSLAGIVRAHVAAKEANHPYTGCRQRRMSERYPRPGCYSSCLGLSRYRPGFAHLSEQPALMRRCSMSSSDRRCRFPRYHRRQPVLPPTSLPLPLSHAFRPRS
jgi:error-prone DNA polymerase